MSFKTYLSLSSQPRHKIVFPATSQKMHRWLIQADKCTKNKKKLSIRANTLQPTAVTSSVGDRKPFLLSLLQLAIFPEWIKMELVDPRSSVATAPFNWLVMAGGYWAPQFHRNRCIHLLPVGRCGHSSFMQHSSSNQQYAVIGGWGRGSGVHGSVTRVAARTFLYIQVFAIISQNNNPWLLSL